MSEIVEQPDLSVDHSPIFTIVSAVEIVPGRNYVIQTDWDPGKMTLAIFESFQQRLHERFPDCKFVVIGRGHTVQDALDLVLAQTEEKADAAESGTGSEPDRA